jgi:hypothetical protein
MSFHEEIHDELAAAAGPLPGAYIETRAFARVTQGRLINAVRLLAGKVLPAGSGVLSASLDLAAINAAESLTVSIAPPLKANESEVDVVLAPALSINVKIFLSADPSKILSDLAISLEDIRVHVRARNNSLVFDGVDYQIRRTITRTPDADDIIKAANIDPLEAARVEGHLAYGVVSQAASLSLAKRSEWPLSSIFPALNFGKSIRLIPIAHGAALGIIPADDVTLVNTSRCTCADSGDLQHSNTTVVNTAPADPQPNNELGKVSIGGPLPDGKNPLKDFGPRSIGGGAAGMYIPRAFASQLTISAMPAIKITASDDGWIGFRAEASIGFKNFRLGFDIQNGGITVDIDLDISVSAYCDMEIFKGLRLPIGWAVVMPTNGSSPANIRIGFYPSVDSNGSVKLKSTLIHADMGSYVAVVIGIGTALKLLGVTAWIGFLIDVVLAAILSNGLPIALKDAIKAKMSNGEWKLIDGLPVFDSRHKMYPAAPFHVRADSLLASVRLDG